MGQVHVQLYMWTYFTLVGVRSAQGIVARVAEVARARERRSPKSLDSDENFKP